MNRRSFIKSTGAAFAAMNIGQGYGFAKENGARPNIILVMTDDQGWGETSYNNHPLLKTPNLDAMAANGLRFDRFYAGGPVCSPTRATVMTGRANARTGVLSHGYALRLQEKTIAQAMQKAGYATGHFGKWHLDGFRGAGAPILKDDPYSPGAFGFDEWLSVTNFFDMNPLMSRKGEFKDFKGDSSEVIVAEALKFIKQKKDADEPSFTVIWYGTPHAPWVASEEDTKPFSHLKSTSAQHYGELAAMDRSVGTLRKGLRDLGIADNTLVWFCSDNGGLESIEPDTVGGLRGFKGSLYEGGIRVPAIIEWPARIKPRITKHPASTMDIMPTLVDVLDLPRDSMLKLVDGDTIEPLFDGEIGRRKKPIVFSWKRGCALIDNEFKIIAKNRERGKYVLYNLDEDHAESNNLMEEKPELAKAMQAKLESFMDSVARSQEGADYPEGKVTKESPHSRFWCLAEEYEPYIEELLERPEYSRYKKKLSWHKKKKNKKKDRKKKK